MENEVYEVVCENCSKPFETTDEMAVYCDKCWQEKVLDTFEFEGKGD